MADRTSEHIRESTLREGGNSCVWLRSVDRTGTSETAPISLALGFKVLFVLGIIKHREVQSFARWPCAREGFGVLAASRGFKNNVKQKLWWAMTGPGALASYNLILSNRSMIDRSIIEVIGLDDAFVYFFSDWRAVSLMIHWSVDWLID